MNAPKARPPGRLASGDGGDDGERVAGLDGGGFFFGEVAHVFVVEIEVHKGTEFALGGKEVLLQIGMRLGECAESFRDGGRVDFNGIMIAREGT